MNFNRLVKTILEDNQEDSSLYSIKVINKEVLVPFIKKDIEDSLRLYDKNPENPKLPPEYEEHVLSLYPTFVGSFVPALQRHLDYTLRETKEPSHEIIEITNTKQLGHKNAHSEYTSIEIDYIGFQYYRFKDEMYLIPIKGQYTCPNNMQINLAHHSEFGPDEPKINWLYSFFHGTFSEFIYEDLSARVTRKNFNLDMVPKEAYDLLKNGDPNSNPQAQKIKSILKDVAEQRFEHTIKSQKVGRVTSKL